MVLRTMLVVLVGVALVGCGRAGAIQAARTARYQITASAAFQAGVAALVDNDYKVANADPVQAKAITAGRWYEADGTFARKNPDGRAARQDGMIFLTIVIAVVADGDAFRVNVTPHALQHRDGYPVEFPLKAADPAMSGWIADKVDNVYLSIHAALKPHAVTPGT